MEKIKDAEIESAEITNEDFKEFSEAKSYEERVRILQRTLQKMHGE